MPTIMSKPILFLDHPFNSSSVSMAPGSSEETPWVFENSSETITKLIQYIEQPGSFVTTLDNFGREFTYEFNQLYQYQQCNSQFKILESMLLENFTQKISSLMYLHALYVATNSFDKFKETNNAMMTMQQLRSLITNFLTRNLSTKLFKLGFIVP